MRTEREMMSLILSFAEGDERVRLVGMEGSRVNANVPRDDLQDYDATYVVTDMRSFMTNDGWLDFFGERIIMQKPEAMSLFPPELGNWFSYLMLFEDGNRIDLKLVPIEELGLYLSHDRLLTVLLDKDRSLSEFPVPTDADYRVVRPSAAHFDDCCNEFWWVSTYVAKGLCRREILYAAEHLNNYVRPALLRMLAWKTGIETGFTLSVGKSYKYLDKYVAHDVWLRLLETYRNDSHASLWNALFGCGSLFQEVSLFVSARLAYPYPDYGKRVAPYIENLFRSYGSRAEE